MRRLFQGGAGMALAFILGLVIATGRPPGRHLHHWHPCATGSVGATLGERLVLWGN
jgi:hypothetical protein